MSPAANVSSIGQEKLSVEKIADGNITCIRFDGVMDEKFEGKRLANSVKSKIVILDMGQISKISSFGIREWSEFISIISRSSEHVYLIECTAKVMDQINMVAGFLAKSRVVSFYSPYRCDYCDIDSDILFQVDKDSAAIRSFSPPEELCETCARPQFFDEDPESFFSSVAQQPQFDLASGVAEFLSAKLNYSVSGGNRRLQIDKHVEGDNTYMRLSGNLDGSFPSEKLADGLEGAVVVDVAGLGSVDIAGAAEWRNFISLARGGAQRIYILDCPPVLLNRLPTAEDLGDEVLSFSMPYTCNTCKTTTSEAIDVTEHYEILKFATPPEIRCGNCKQPTSCAAQESLLSHLRNLPKPSADAKLRSFIKVARKRKPEKQAADENAARGVDGKTKMLMVASLVGVLGAGGGMLYYVSQQSDTQDKLDEASAQIKELVNRERTERPAWITSDTHFAGYCVDRIDVMTCVGVSSFRGTKEEATAEARDVVFEQIAGDLAIKFESELFDSQIRPLYSDTRSELLSLYNESIGSDEEKEAASFQSLSSARKRAAEILVATSSDSMPQQHSSLYWEQYNDGEEEEWIVYTRFDINTDAVRKMGTAYITEKDVGGGRGVTATPLLAWSYVDFTGGVIVTEAAGQLEDAKVGAIITSVGGQPTKTVAQLSKALEAGGEIDYAIPVERQDK